MPKITVDGTEYDTENLSTNGKAQLASLQFLEVQMQKLKGCVSNVVEILWRRPPSGLICA